MIIQRMLLEYAFDPHEEAVSFIEWADHMTVEFSCRASRMHLFSLGR